MPTYEYACKDCGHQFDVVQSFSDDALTECPSCEGRLRKVFSAAGIIFKGSGWHIKDYANAGTASGSTSSSESSASESGTSSGGDTSGDGSGSTSAKTAASKADSGTASSDSSSASTSSTTSDTAKSA